MDRNTMMMVAIGALILAVLYLYRENQKLKLPAGDLPTGAWEPPASSAKKKKVVSFEENDAEKSVPTESE